MKTHTKTLQLHDWMLALGLTEKEERVYALIYGYSQDGMSRMRGTAGSIAEWLHCSEITAKRIIWSLEDKGLIGHEVIAWSNGKIGGTLTEFWANDPETATTPGKRDKIAWKRRAVGSRMNRVGRFTDEPTPLIGTTRNKYIFSGGGKNSARSRARKTTTTTGFLFENSDTGQQAGNPLPLTLPFEESYFREAWEMLLRQPAWAGKSPEALAIQLEEFQECGDPVLATYCIRLAIKKGWSDIKDIQAIFTADMDQVLAFADVCNARREEGKA